LAQQGGQPGLRRPLRPASFPLSSSITHGLLKVTFIDQHQIIHMLFAISRARHDDRAVPTAMPSAMVLHALRMLQYA
jgi:hypothetical protein